MSFQDDRSRSITVAPPSTAPTTTKEESCERQKLPHFCILQHWKPERNSPSPPQAPFCRIRGGCGIGRPLLVHRWSLENYTDYSGGSSPDEILNLCEGSGFFTEIVSRIDPKQLENLLQDIDELAAYNNACAGWSNIIREIKKISAELQKGGCKPDKGG